MPLLESTYTVSDQSVVEVLPLHPPVQPEDGEQPLPPVPVSLPTGELLEVSTLYCRAMNWVAVNQCTVALAVVAAWWLLTKNGRK
jgi:hypothetical protein